MVLALSIIYTKEEVKVYVCEHCGVKKQPTFLMSHYPDLGGASDWSCSEEICFIHSEVLPKSIWAVTGHQYEMSARVPQT